MAIWIYFFVLAYYNIGLCTIAPAKVVSSDALSAADKNDTNLTTTTARIATESKEITTKIISNKHLDLAFIMDSTGSMAPYINNVRQHISNLVDEISASSSTDLRVALIEYRDHVPQESSFVTRKHDFTDSIKTMKTWLSAAHASGGGDGPEAVSDALYEATKLTWRKNAAKISVLISDAPPHGLVPSEDSSFPDGSPNGHDPVDIARQLAKREVTLYTVGCEPSIIPYKDFFMALAYLTGGQYIPLSDSRRLIDAIIGGAQEELSLQKFSKDVEKEIKRVQDSGGRVSEQSIAESVYQKLQKEGAKAKQLLRNNKPLETASEGAIAIAAAHSMADVRKTFKKGERQNIFAKDSGRYVDSLDFSVGSPYIGDFLRSSGIKETRALKTKPASMSGKKGETYSAIESGVSFEQISRLVKKKTAKLSV